MLVDIMFCMEPAFAEVEPWYNEGPRAHELVGLLQVVGHVLQVSRPSHHLWLCYINLLQRYKEGGRGSIKRERNWQKCCLFSNFLA